MISPGVQRGTRSEQERKESFRMRMLSVGQGGTFRENPPILFGPRPRFPAVTDLRKERNAPYEWRKAGILVYLTQAGRGSRGEYDGSEEDFSGSAVPPAVFPANWPW